MLAHIILPFRRPFCRAFADLSRPQKSTDFASHMFRLYIRYKQRFRDGPHIGIMEKRMEATIVYCGYIGIMEKKMEATIVYWGDMGIMEKKLETSY